MPQFNQELYDFLVENCIAGYNKYKRDYDGNPLPSPSEEAIAEHKRRFEWACAYDGVAPSKVPPLSEYMKPKKHHRFLTISLPKTTTPARVAKEWERYLSNKSYAPQVKAYTYEFTNQALEYHPHIHVLMIGTKSPQKHRLIRDISSHFKIEKNFIDIVTHTDPEIFKTRMNYIKGEKDSEKEAQVKKDKEIRCVHNLKDFYL